MNELQAKYERMRLLYEVGNVIHSSLDPREALDLILGQALQLTRANSASVSLLNPTSGFLEIEASCGLPISSKGFQLPIEQGITGWVARTGKAIRCGDVSSDPRYVSLRLGVRSELAVPMDIRGVIRGVLNVDSDLPNAFTNEDQTLLVELAIQAEKAIQNTWLYEQLRFKAKMFESLVSVNQMIQSTLNLNEALDEITRQARTLMSVKLCSLLMLDASGHFLELRSSIGAGKGYKSKDRLDIRESIAGRVVRSQKPLQIIDVGIFGIDHFDHYDHFQKEGLVSLLCVPLMEGKSCIGVLNVYTEKRHNFSDEEVRILSAFASASASAIERARLYEHIREVEEKLRQNEKLSALGLLSAEIAHEIRNPLTVMKMISHGLGSEFAKGDPRFTDARVLGEKMDHLNRIVERILAFARQGDPTWERIDLSLILDDLALLIRHKLQQHKIILCRKWNSPLPLIQADATQLEQAFLNLTLNAIEAMPEGGRLIIQTGKKAGEVWIEFEDEGMGMDLDMRVKAFSSVLNSDKPSGNGLGLAIVRRIVEAHSGKLLLKSSIGKGTTFTIIIPIKQSSQSSKAFQMNSLKIPSKSS